MRIFLLSHTPENRIYHLSAKEKRYLFSVLRKNINDTFTAADRNGNYYKAFLFDEESMSIELTDNPEETLNDNLSAFSGPFFPITMYISVLKGKKNETEIRMLTEIGVDKIILMNTEFTEGTWNSHMSERIEAIAREAVQQSGSKAPEIYGPIDFRDAVEEAEGTLLILHQSKRNRTECLTDIKIKDRVSCLIGPEGGFSDKECELAEEHGAIPILLRTNILRAETAAVYTASSLQTILHG